MICLVFILESPAWVRAIVSVKEAEQILNSFKEEKLPKRLAGSNQFGMWGVETSKIVAIHTLPMEEANKQPGINL